MPRFKSLDEIAYRPIVAGVDRDDNYNPAVLRQICSSSVAGIDYNAINDFIDGQRKGW